jgi:hypothetical protein
MFSDARLWSQIPTRNQDPHASVCGVDWLEDAGAYFRPCMGASQSDRARSSELRGLLQTVEVVE